MWDVSAQWRTFETSLRPSIFYTEVSVRDAFCLELDRVWPADISHKQETRGRQCNYWHSPCDPASLGIPTILSRWLSPFLSENKPKLPGRNKQKKKERNFLLLEGCWHLSQYLNLFQRSDAYPTCNREAGRQEHGCWINGFIVSTMGFSGTSTTFHFQHYTEVALSGCFLRLPNCVLAYICWNVASSTVNAISD